MDRVRAGVVGVGHMGEYHVGVYAELFDVDLIGIADIDPERAQRVAAKYGTRAMADYRELFETIDVVSIVVPTAQHYAVAREFLSHGVHVLLEKPITHQLEEARELFHLAAERRVVLQVGHVERFNGAVQELKKIVKDPFLIESRRLGPFVARGQNDGVILDLMIHDLDIILQLVKSPIANINAVGAAVFAEPYDIANVQIHFANGCIANVVASRATQHKIRTLAVTERDAYIFLNYTDQDITIHRQASSRHVLTREELTYRQEAFIERVFVHKDNPLKLEIKHLLEMARNGAASAVSMHDELYSLEVALQIIEMCNEQRMPAGTS